MVSKSVAICRDYLSCRTHLNRLTEHRTVTRSTLLLLSSGILSEGNVGAGAIASPVQVLN